MEGKISRRKLPSRTITNHAAGEISKEVCDTYSSLTNLRPIQSSTGNFVGNTSFHSKTLICSRKLPIQPHTNNFVDNGRVSIGMLK